jgi:hypothetical protein
MVDDDLTITLVCDSALPRSLLAYTCTPPQRNVLTKEAYMRLQVVVEPKRRQCHIDEVMRRKGRSAPEMPRLSGSKPSVKMACSVSSR